MQRGVFVDVTKKKVITFHIKEDDQKYIDLIRERNPAAKSGVVAIRTALSDYYNRHALQPEERGGKDADLKEIKETTKEILRAVNDQRHTTIEQRYTPLDRKLWLFLMELRDRVSSGDIADVVKDLGFWISLYEPPGESG